MQRAERAIRDVHSTWIEAVNAGDLGRLATLMTDDVVFVSPGQAPVGRDGLAANFSTVQRQMHVQCTSELEEVVVVGGVAYTRSRDVVTVTPRDGGAATRVAGYRVTIYREQSDGRWLLARDTHTLSQMET